ncbi:unnamed protein product [Mesocestoides corti]|uniref:RRM domain-containing protein n=1 Tax=Mesocestoides corti TaxID=53468 RepID=A0A0R3UNX5_MESCO|nr:unnamed protein product [Mesocestoides corti]
MYPEDPDEPSLSSSSSEDGDDDGQEDMENLEAEIAEVSQQASGQTQSRTVETNPYLYDAHTRLITLLRKASELDRLRAARERMSQHFPLTPELWLEWIKDEMSLLTDGNDREPVYKLFKRALADYQNVDVWLEYCQFAIGGMAVGEANQLDRTRAVLEEALANQGLNFRQGALLFEVYREFEIICYAQLQSEAPSDTVAITNQLKKIDSIFRRQLSTPHVDLEETMTEYKSFLEGIGAGLVKIDENSEEGGVSADCLAAYTAAQTKWDAVEPYESAVSDAEGDEKALLLAWEAYLNWAVSKAPRKGNRANVAKKAASGPTDVSFTPLEVLCLFERAITDLCLQPSIWLQMADYLEVFVSADLTRLVSTLSRSVRNIPWSSQLWCRYALACEARAWALAVESAPESMNNGGSSQEASQLSKELDVVQEVYESALKCGFPSAADLSAVWIAYCDFLLRRLRHSTESDSEPFPDQGDQDCLIYRYWAFVEAKFLDNKERAQDLWTQMTKTGHNGSKPAFWLAYLDFEKNHGDLDHLVRVAGMAVNSVTGEYAETVFQAARRCLAESGIHLRRLRDFDVKVVQRRAHLSSAVASKKEKKEQDASAQSLQQKGKRPAGGSEAPPPAAISKSGKRKTEASHEPPIKRSKKDGEDSSKEVSDAGASEKPSKPKHGESVPHDPTKDDRTVFVSNLPFATTKEELETIFKQCGKLASIRIVRDYAGKSKGFGYVEFEDPSCVPSALAMDRHPIEVPGVDVGRPMFVSVCETNRKAGTKAFAYSTGGPEPKKLFVRNLDKQVREEALKTFFGKYGQVTGVRIATFRNGVPKGLAYVEFATEDEASRALVATDGVVIGSKAISVAISNPPQRSSGQSDGGASLTQASHATKAATSAPA